jgi:hypothetical protein
VKNTRNAEKARALNAHNTNNNGRNVHAKGAGMQSGTAVSGAIGAARHTDAVIVTLTGAPATTVYESALARMGLEADQRPFRTLIINLTHSDPDCDWEGGTQASGKFCRAHHVHCALVVPTWMLLLARSECFRQTAASGLIWVAFLRLPDALEWAASWGAAPGAHALPPQSRYEHPSPQFLH